MKTQVITQNAPKATGPFSQAIITGELIFTSGQIHLTPEGILVTGSIEEQTHQVMKNLQAILNEAGTTFDTVIKTTIYLTDMSLYNAVNTVYGSYFITAAPARETVCVAALPLGARVEISMIATITAT